MTLSPTNKQKPSFGKVFEYEAKSCDSMKSAVNDIHAK